MASVVEICNGALIRLGANTITSIDDNSATARACKAVYDRRRRALLTAHPWNCGIKRASLAEDATTPDFGKAHAYTLPSDYLRLLPPDPIDNFPSLDWQIEGRQILSDYAAPLNIRYIFDLEDPNTMDTLFREALSIDIANELCEKITQSNTKKADLTADRQSIIREARRTNAILNVAAEPPTDSWIAARA